MNKLNDKAIAEAAYYIWKNNGCPANTHAQDWAAAIQQLSAAKSATRKTAANASVISKISTADINALNRLAAAKGKKISPVNAAGKLLAINLAAATNAALKTKTKTPLRKI
mgnify:CR=1 FL=1